MPLLSKKQVFIFVITPEIVIFSILMLNIVAVTKFRLCLGMLELSYINFLSKFSMLGSAYIVSFGSKLKAVRLCKSM